MRAVDLIRKKREGQELTAEEIGWLVQGLVTGVVPEYQWSALLMAVLWRGMTDEETAALTDSMLHSGTVVDLSEIPGPKIDKHSTGGVGDKTSLILAPIAAACGVNVPMVSGRGLGHTGGTLDKLEAIPGFNVRLDLRRYREVLAECGLVLIGQTEEIAPADRKLYALRDATATVESIPLITASILSKKLAEGIDGLVLDVKTGDGAFMEREEDARALAMSMGKITRSLGKDVVVLLTRMDQPLGRGVGNGLEVEEAIACLKGEGDEELTELSVDLAAEMVRMGGRAGGLEEAKGLCWGTIRSGSALERFRRLVEAQGGDPRVVDEPERLPRARRLVPIEARRDGFVRRLRSRPVGLASMLLGAGRERVDSAIDHAVGVLVSKKEGEEVMRGEVLCTLLVNDESRLEEAVRLIEGAYEIGEERLERSGTLIDRIQFDQPMDTTGG